MLVLQLLQESSAVVQLPTLQAKVPQQLLQEGAVLCLNKQTNKYDCVVNPTSVGYWRGERKVREGTGVRERKAWE